MKKILKILFVICSISTLVLFSGCGIYDKIDLNKVKKEIQELKTVKIDLSKIREILDDKDTFGELEEIDEKRLSDFNIDLEYIQKVNGKLELIFKQEKNNEINTISMSSYIIVKPAEDKKELLKKQIESYFANLLQEYNEKVNATEEGRKKLQGIMKKEYEGYLIYILSDNNEFIWEKIEKSSHSLLFENTISLSLEQFSKIFSLEQKDIVEYQAVMPTKDTSASFYVIVRPKRGKVEVVRKKMNQYMKELEEKWSTYLPEEYELVKNKMETEIGSYFVYIVSKENGTVLNTIKNSIMKKDE